MSLTTNRGRLCIFVYNVGIEPTIVCSKIQMRYHYANCNLPRCAATVAQQSFGLPNTTHHIPFVLRTTRRCFTTSVHVSQRDHQPLTLRSSLWVQPLRHEHYTFSYQLASWFCMEVSTTCYFLSTCVTLAGA